MGYPQKGTPHLSFAMGTCKRLNCFRGNGRLRLRRNSAAIGRLWTAVTLPRDPFSKCGWITSCTTLKVWETTCKQNLQGFILPGFLEWCVISSIHNSLNKVGPTKRVHFLSLTPETEQVHPGKMGPTRFCDTWVIPRKLHVDMVLLARRKCQSNGGFVSNVANPQRTVCSFRPTQIMSTLKCHAGASRNRGTSKILALLVVSLENRPKEYP